MTQDLDGLRSEIAELKAEASSTMKHAELTTKIVNALDWIADAIYELEEKEMELDGPEQIAAQLRGLADVLEESQRELHDRD